MWFPADCLYTTLPSCRSLPRKRAHHQPEHQVSPRPLGRRHGSMRDCCTWLSSSLTRLLLRFLPVLHFATRKMQPMYGQLTRPMWHYGLTAKVLASDIWASYHHSCWSCVSFMRVATEWLKLESRGFHYKVALCTAICLLSLMIIFEGVPWSEGLKISWGGFQLRGTISWRLCEIELRPELITNRKSFI